MNNRSLFYILPVLLAALGNWFHGDFIPEGNQSSTPNIRHHRRQTRYNPNIPNGKWVMKYHRGRH